MSNFPQAYFKVERAKEHLDELQRVTMPLHPLLYRIRWSEGFLIPSAFAVIADDANMFIGNANPKVRQLIYEPTADIPAYLSTVIGDCIHNLRAALDYAATAVVRAVKEDTSFVTFPFHEEREKLISAQSSGLRAIQAAIPNVDVEKFFRDTIRSYRGGNFPLWTLNKLDKIDKHNALIPSIAISDIMASSLPDPRVRNCAIGHNASQVAALFTTDTLVDETQYDLKISIAIRFAERDFFWNEPVIPTLLNMVEITSEALKAFDRFVGEAKT